MGNKNHQPVRGSSSAKLPNKVKESLAKSSQDQYGMGELCQNWQQIKDGLAAGVNELKEKGISSMTSILPFLQDTDLLKWTESLTKDAATDYDKAMDQEYLETHLRGGNHRLFDDGHTLTDSWDRVTEALPDDSFGQELVGWTRTYMKDLTTKKGMPFFNLDKTNYETSVEAFAGEVPGLDRDYLYDLLSFDAMEICTAGLGAVSVFFAFKQDDKRKLSEILGAMGISSIVSANPILGLTTIAVTAYSYWKHNTVDTSSVIKGGGLSAFSTLMFSIMGLPILVELVIVLALSTLLKKHIINDKKFIIWLKTQIRDSLTGPKEFLDLDRLLSLAPSRA